MWHEPLSCKANTFCIIKGVQPLWSDYLKHTRQNPNAQQDMRETKHGGMGRGLV